MRRLDDVPLDPEVAASLDAIDATLAGEPVDPAYAELAELALLLTADRPQPTGALSAVLDARVERRFAPPPRPTGEGRRKIRWWLWTPAAGIAAAVLAAIVIVLGGSSGARSSSTTAASVAAPASSSARGALAAHTAPTRAAAHPGRALNGVPLSQSTNTAASAPSQASAVFGPSQPAPNNVLQPPVNGRKIIQSAQLSLTTAPARIDDVAQELFVVVGQVRGIVKNSQVTETGGPGGYAQFQLNIPSGSMPQAMAALSSLRYARVASRTDTTQDVNNQYQADVQRLSDDRAIRASLLRRLANATTQGQIDSLTIRIRDSDTTISSDQATLAALNAQINYSQVTVTINGGITPVPVQAGRGGGLTFGKAAHDAGRVLTVAAGVALIGLAALVPIALLGALGWWVIATLRRRRREHALDAV